MYSSIDSMFIILRVSPGDTCEVPGLVIIDNIRHIGKFYLVFDGRPEVDSF